MVGNKCHNVFLFISVCNIRYIDVSCSELNDVLVMTVGDQTISELEVHKVHSDACVLVVLLSQV